jgi:hypothetical protein
MVNILLAVCVLFLLVAFVTLAHELGRIRRVLYEQGRTIDTLNHIDTIQSRQLDIQRARLNRLRPLVPFITEPSIEPPYCPAHQVKCHENSSGTTHQDH